MNFIDHTTNWIQGEIFEASLTTIAGILVLIGTALLWKYGVSAAARGLILPLLIAGFIMSAGGTSTFLSNQKRMAELSENQNQPVSEFILQEKQRVEAFMPWYQYVRVIATVLLITGVGAIWLSNSSTLHGIALALMLLALSALVIDHFSHARAQIYYQEIVRYEGETT